MRGEVERTKVVKLSRMQLLSSGERARRNEGRKRMREGSCLWAAITQC